MLGRLSQRGDFERLLAVPACSREAHFVLHHLAERPGAAKSRPSALARSKLSTSDAPMVDKAVDDLPSGHWLGSVVPKRHARRAVTRNLLRRQIRAAVQRRQQALPAGLWLVRLRRPFAPAQFISADSKLLRRAVAAELDRLLSRAAL